MQIQNNISPTFKGIKYYNYNDTVVNTYFNYKIAKGGFFQKKAIANIMKQQENNPHHIILDYRAIDEGNSVQESAIVDGKEFIRKRFEKVSSMIKRAAKYANKLNKNNEVAQIPHSDRLNDFKLLD